MSTLFPTDNELLAKEFMAYIASTYDKRWKRFQFQLAKHRLTLDVGAEDVFTDTLMKCHNRITREGLAEGRAYGAYFDRATENNLIQYKMKAQNQGAQLAVIETVPQETLVHGEGSTRWDAQYAEHSVLPPGFTAVDPDPDFDADTYPSDEERHLAQVMGAFHELPEKYRDVLRMVAAGLRYKEIQRALQLRKDQVKMRILTARALVKERLQELQHPDEGSDYLDTDDEGSDYC